MPSLTPGSFVIWNDQSWLLLDIPETTRALLKHPKTGKAELVDVLELKLSGTTEPNSKKALVSISQKSWQEIQRQFSLLQPLLRKGQRQRTYKDIDQVAKQLGKGRVTIYRWLNKLENSQTASALLRDKRRDFGVSRLSDKINDIITDKIDNFYLVKERPSVVELWEQVAIECKARGLKPPAISTIHKRLDQVQDRLIMAKRFSHKKAREKFEPLHGSFPGANVPLAVYQVDHTPADIILVDDVSRLPIGRPYLTIVVDTCTRMLSGFCLTLDPPSALSTGLALTHAILPKKTWLTKHQIDAEWPIYGVPHKIYADNAKEFRGTMLERACHEYGIIMENRPKGLPNYGGHVERLFRTFMRRVQSLKGSTFSNVQNRGEYNSEGKAVFTLNEFEHWFGIFVTKVYHQRPHRGIGRMSPIKLYERHILGDENTLQVGLPAPIEDERKLILDFMPFSERTIQEYGVRIQGIHYYADCLRPWIHARDSNNTKLKRKFIFARDPRDISVIYFLDPETGQYYDIPYGDTKHPPMSQWELIAIMKRLGERPELEINEELIFEGLTQMRQIQENAAERSKQARRLEAKRKNWNKRSPIPQKVEQRTTTKRDFEPSESSEPLLPFRVEEAE